MKQIETTRKFRGYEARQEPTNIDSLNEGVLIAPSKNVIVTTEGVVQSRGGLQKFGTASGKAVVSTFDWETNRNQYHNLRTTDNKLQVYFNDDWFTILSGTNRDRTSFGVWWDNDQKLDTLLFVNGNDSVYSWTGAIAKITDSTGTAVTVEVDNEPGDATEAGFRVSDIVSINGSDYTIQSFNGNGAMVLNGTPGAAAGDVVYIKVAQTSTFNFTLVNGVGAATQFTDTSIEETFGFTFDVIYVYNNHAVFGSNKNQRAFYSKLTAWDDFSFAAPRLVGDGDTFVLDAPTTVIFEDSVNNWVVVSSGPDKMFGFREQRIQTTDSSAYIEIKRFISGSRSGVLNQHSWANIKNTVAFINHQNELDTLGRLEQINTIQSQPLSWKVSVDMKSYDLTDSQVFFFENNVLISIPVHSKVLLYDLEQQIWQPPIDMDIRAFSVMNNMLVGHDSQGQSHHMFKGTNDNNSPIQQNITFSYSSYGKRYHYKRTSLITAEGYLNLAGKATYKRLYDYASSGGSVSHRIDRSDKDSKIADQGAAFGIGRYSFGTVGFGSTQEGDGYTFNVNMFKFRTFKGVDPTDFFEDQVSFEITEKDAVFVLVSYGSNAAISSNNAIRNLNSTIPETNEITRPTA